MVVSHKYKFIFIAIPKTAGTSIHNYLRRNDPDCIYLYKNQPTGSKGLQKHSIAKKALQHFPEDYFSFCFVRNPWDRAASYHQMIERQRKDYVRNFEQFVKNPQGSENAGSCSQAEWCCDDKGKVLVDYIGTFENLIEDFINICDRVALPFENLPKGRLEHWMNSNVSDYSSKFTPASIDKIYDNCQWEIDKFGYKRPMRTKT